MINDNVIDIKGRIPLIIEPLNKKEKLRLVSAWVKGDSVFIELKRGKHTFQKKEKFSLQISKRGFRVEMCPLEDK